MADVEMNVSDAGIHKNQSFIYVPEAEGC